MNAFTQPNITIVNVASFLFDADDLRRHPAVAVRVSQTQP